MFQSIFNKILTFFGYLLRGSKDKTLPTDAVPSHLLKGGEGFNGRLQADALLLQEDDRIVLSVDFFFADVPSWLEWDVSRRKLAIVQMGGAVAELDIDLPASNVTDFERAKKVLLVTRKGDKRLEMANDQKLIHAINMIVRH